jgi:raffinose/stachyose/melibiose transport system permease protein
MTSLQKRKHGTGWFIFGFTAVPVALMLLFTYYPAAKLVLYSFTDYDGISAEMGFVGLRNWAQLLGNREAWETLSHCLYYIAGGLVQNALALFLAVILNNPRLRGRNVFRGLIFLPFILNGAAVSYMFRYVYNYTKGPLNIALIALGIAPVSWLGSAAIVNWSMAFVCLWRYSGYIMVIYLAGLQSIPGEYYEAAMIDGCGAFSRFRHITLPQISNVIKLQMFLNISGAVNVFDIPFVITSGGPVGASMTLAMRSNEYAFTYRNFGLASAYGVFCTLVIVVLYVTQNKLLYRKEN